jgi:hypothetical protein
MQWSRNLEIDALINYAQRFLGSLRSLWQDASVEDRVRFQQIAFPEGLSYSAGDGFRTEQTSSIFELFGAILAEDSSLVSPMGFEPMLSP